MTDSNQNDQWYVEVVFPIPIQHGFTYIVPHHLRPLVCPGIRVLAPFGKRTLTGYVIQKKTHTDITDLKEIEDILDDKPCLSSTMLDLTKWISEYYLSSWGEVIDAALPTGINLETRRRIHLADDLDREKIHHLNDLNQKQRDLLLLLFRTKNQLVNQLENKVGKINLNYNLLVLAKKGYITISRELIEPKVRVKYANHVCLNPDLRNSDDLESKITDLYNKNSRQAELLKELAKHPEGILQTDLLRRTKVSSSTLKTANKNNLISIEKREVFRNYYSGYDIRPIEPITLNRDQRSVLQQLFSFIGTKSFTPVLLFGVTGSGKTQIYIESLLKVREYNRNAIVLVPEIALTPQTVSWFKAYFGDDIAVLHSRMSDGERYDSWRNIRSGKVHIVIGPRSAIFAPLQNIGLIVVDEEQEASYKQGDLNPRYHARDVALMRGKMNQAVVILGSATPSMESFYNAQTRKYRLLELPQRVEELPMPNIEIVDMRKEWKQNKKHLSTIFSKNLIEKIAERITSQEQVIILQNRRGFSTFILCRECGYVEQCINCNITLTYHLKEHRLRCHYCNYQKAAPETCQNCGGYNIAYRGTGTQKVEEEVKRLFPSVRTVRMDIDTTSRKGSHDRILRDFRNQEYDILLGTQMVAKGLDFPKVTLVGVVSADTTLQLPDFRSSERTFQLLTQVAGRSGRKGKQGEVIIQTYAPQNHSIIFAKKHDYLRFFAKEIQERKELNYPPFSRLIVINFRGKKEEHVQESANNFVTHFPRKRYYQILGPAPAPLSRLKDEYRYHIIIKYDRRLDSQGKNIRKEMNTVLKNFKHPHRQTVKISVDVDPTDLF